MYRKSVFILAIILAFALGSVVSAHDSHKKVYVLTPYVVEQGDTLWDIAGEFRNESEDVRDVVDRIREYNHITPDIQVGDSFIIPVLVESNKWN